MIGVYEFRQGCVEIDLKSLSHRRSNFSCGDLPKRLRRNYYTDEVVDTELLSLPGPYIRDLVPRNSEPGRVHFFVVQIGKFIETVFKEYKPCICLGYLQMSAVASHSVNSEKLTTSKTLRSSFPKPNTWTELSEKQCMSVSSHKVSS